MMKKKGQGALEYLTVYGWGLLVILVIGLALYSLNMLTPSTYTKSTCTGFQYFIHHDQSLSEDDYKLVLLNGGDEVDIINVTIDGTKLGISEPAATVKPGKKFTIDVVDDPTTENTGDDFRIIVEISYDTGYLKNKTDTGICIGIVE